ncbi:MAG: protein translocase subunit SecF [Candidatus Caenarcaniphilales bacterium]|nr:protein translocase subunit SecF [Candidatus Caenarcaniphilales bacterium]
MSSPSVTGKKDKNINSSAIKEYPKIVEKANLWYALSGTLILISIVAIFLSFSKFGSPVKLGLDFTGGSKIEYSFKNPSKEITPGSVRDQVLSKINDNLAAEAVAQVAENKFLILRTKEISIEDREKLDSLLKETFGDFEVLAVDTVSGTIGPELLNSGLLALGITLAGILVFVSYRFRRDFALCAILALCHDVIIVVGTFAILGLVKGVEVNVLFLTACLTVLGFSIHDTIVVFDRVRENTKYLSKKKNLVQIINESISQVWFRSVCTSLTVLMTLGALYIFGGETTKIFAGAMFAGVVTGSYSSIFIASVTLGVWNQKYESKRVSKSSK